jgi:hypothetical protein
MKLECKSRLRKEKRQEKAYNAVAKRNKKDDKKRRKRRIKAERKATKEFEKQANRRAIEQMKESLKVKKVAEKAEKLHVMELRRSLEEDRTATVKDPRVVGSKGPYGQTDPAATAGWTTSIKGGRTESSSDGSRITVAADKNVSPSQSRATFSSGAREAPAARSRSQSISPSKIPLPPSNEGSSYSPSASVRALAPSSRTNVASGSDTNVASSSRTIAASNSRTTVSTSSGSGSSLSDIIVRDPVSGATISLPAIPPRSCMKTRRSLARAAARAPARASSVPKYAEGWPFKI